MKIALLNLLYDNNYGGHLQRYALMHIIEGMGHTVEHLNCGYTRMGVVGQMKEVARSLLCLVPALEHRYADPNYAANKFYNRYVKHTKVITNRNELIRYTDYDLFVVGSDQVWRKSYMTFGMNTYFFDYLPDDKPRVAYAASLGLDADDYTEEEVLRLKPLYEKFRAVSVREKNALDILVKRKWIKPQAQLAIDPTLLLDKEEYLKIISDNKTIKPNGQLFLYTLDLGDELTRLIEAKDLKKKYTSYTATIKTRVPCSIPQWLRNIAESECVVTDSYHGLVFSIIFNKPYYLIENTNRGVARFQSLFELLGLQSDGLDMSAKDWQSVNNRIKQLRSESIDFLKENLK